MTVEIPLTHGQVALVDDADSDLLKYDWRAHFSKHYADGGAYVAERRYMKNSQSHTVAMHRQILARMMGRELSRKEITDHIDRNPLNNCRANLRLATPAQNNMNTGKRRHNTSGFKGAYYVKSCGKWVSLIGVNGKSRYLGIYLTPQEAHEAYKKAAIEHYGQFARFE